MSKYVDIDKYNEFLRTCEDRDFPCINNCVECYFKNSKPDDVEKLAMENVEMKEILRKACKANECTTCPFVVDNVFCEIAAILVPNVDEEEID